ncbi:MAG: hypothetical protein QOE80_3652 [Actinomycetota bacterium]|nr:hypothetical protein [Actinomycetota bacterium]
MSWRPRRLAILLVGAAAVAAWVGYLYALTWHAYGSHSDSANAARAGHDLVTGNPLLKGWKLPADSYWSIDLPVFGVLSALFGLSPRIVHLAPLLIAVLALGVSGYCIRSRRSGWPVEPGLVVLLLLLGLPHAQLAYILFQGPWHVGTAVLCLAAFTLAGAPVGSRRWVGAVVLLTAAVVGDPLALAIGVAPVAGTSALRALRTRRTGDAVRSGVPVTPSRGHGAVRNAGSWGHAMASGMAPVVGAVLVRVVLAAAGGFAVATTETSPLSNVVPNLRHVPRLLGALLGVGRLSGLSSAGEIHYGPLDQAAHLAGAALLAAAVLASTVAVALRTLRAALRRSPGAGAGAHADADAPAHAEAHVQARGLPDAGEEWLDTVLVLGFWSSIAAYAIVAAPDAGLAGARYLPAPLLFGVTLAGRQLRRLPTAPKPLRRGGALLLAGLLPLYLMSSLRLLGHAAPVDPDARLAATLLSRHLDFGYAPYWIASNTVLHSRGRLTILPVESVDGRLRAFAFYADRAVPRRSPPPEAATFVVYRADTGWGNVDLPSARATFGEPAAVETLGPYTVLTYSG